MREKRRRGERKRLRKKGRGTGKRIEGGEEIEGRINTW